MRIIQIQLLMTSGSCRLCPANGISGYRIIRRVSVGCLGAVLHTHSTVRWIGPKITSVRFVEVDMTDSEFWDACDKFDWFYEFSDDNDVWRRGERAQSTLLRQATPEQLEIFNKFRRHHYSGPSYNTEKQPKPERPT